MPTTKPILGLLGGPGSGKSFVARLFIPFGGAVIDADKLANATLDEPDVRDQLVAWWGDGILHDTGRINRKAVGKIVFNDRAELQKLESVVHPRVRQERLALREKYLADPAVTVIVEDVPLLLEKGLDEGCDRLVFVDAPRGVRLQRVAEHRGWSVEDLNRRENYQLPLDIKRRRADDVINNSGGEAEVSDQIHRLLSRIIPPDQIPKV